MVVIINHYFRNQVCHWLMTGWIECMLYPLPKRSTTQNPPIWEVIDVKKAMLDQPSRALMVECLIPVCAAAVAVPILKLCLTYRDWSTSIWPKALDRL